MRWLLLLLSALVLAAPAQALTPAQALALAQGDTESRIAALNELVAMPDDKTMALIQALSDDAVKVTDTAVIVIKDGKGFDPVSGAQVAVPDTAEDVINNNQMRTELGAALALVGLQSPDTKIRLDAVKTLASDPSEDKLPLIEKAYAAESVPAIKDALADLRFALLLGNADKAKRLEASPTRWPNPARRPPSCCCRSASRSRPTSRCAPRCARRSTRSTAAWSGASGSA